MPLLCAHSASNRRHSLTLAVVLLAIATAVSAAEPAPAAAPAPAPVAPKGGGRGPVAPATPDELLAQVVAPPEFETTLFATADRANYPVSVAAAPDGTVYVASDGNASLGVDLGRGRI